MNAQLKAEFGDFQTPLVLTKQVCRRLSHLDIVPDVVIEPTCGKGAFLLQAINEYPKAQIHGYEINADYLDELKGKLPEGSNVKLHHADFFDTDWNKVVEKHKGKNILFLGNPPWVTSSALGSMGSGNLPEKSNFLKFKGLDAVTGKANFDISEWMLLRLLQAMSETPVTLAMLVKTQVARKIISYADKNGIEGVASIHLIDAKLHFNASVDACLFVLRTTGHKSSKSNDYKIFDTLHEVVGKIVGHREGLPVSDLKGFERHRKLLGTSPQKWRSGVKHDASKVMELNLVDGNLINGLGDVVNIEPLYVYPLMKGSDVANNKYRGKMVLVTQKTTKDDTSVIEGLAPKTWGYLLENSHALDRRTSVIYQKSPRFALFGIGDYAFRPYRIAICGLYKKLAFRLIEPINGKTVMFDDTVYYVSFDTKKEALEAYERITSPEMIEFYSSLIFWDEKRPIKASLLNVVDWTKV